MLTTAPAQTAPQPHLDGAAEAVAAALEGVAAEFSWELRDSRIIDHRDGSIAFEQLQVEVPQRWSLNATNILAQKYLRGTPGTAARESSLRQVVTRIVGTITRWGSEGGYFDTAAAAATFAADLARLLYAQRAAFNSPVWFNIGVDGVPQQASACFILSVDDTMDSILQWYVNEGRIFKGGSGSGVNLSKIRASVEPLAGGGTASGPVSFMRGADASAGTIKSGGKTRRAAKMVLLDADHPDIEEFIWCKAREERKSRVLADAGYDMSLNGIDAASVQYQNANNSVRLSDDFMRSAQRGANWPLLSRVDGSVLATPKASKLLDDIAAAAWECADPGVQFSTTINRWHTTPTAGPINASNPCSEYVHLDNSACNLASLNLLKFLDGDCIDLDAVQAAVRVIFTAQDILVGGADYPTQPIAHNARAYRQLGLGYANLGALLMALGLPYDSDDARALAAAITALITGTAYHTSARLAQRCGPFDGYNLDQQATLKILSAHRSAARDTIDSRRVPIKLYQRVLDTWDSAITSAEAHGVRNSQATVLAPTGTIGLLMDCDTTGIEPDLALVKTKRLVGGGTMQIVNRTVPEALQRLGYDSDASDRILSHIAHSQSIATSAVRAEHRAVFACSLGDDPISPLGHIKMMAAVQPFLSGAISKTINTPTDTTPSDIRGLIEEGWRLGLKSLAVYRDASKLAQPLSAGKEPAEAAQAIPAPQRRRLPKTRTSTTFEFRIADCKGFVTVGEYPDKAPGEIFLKVSKQGSTLAGIMDALAISLSHGLQYGVPLSSYVETYTGMRFEPAGITDDADIRLATSLIDYLFRKLAVMYLTQDQRAAIGVYTATERSQPSLPGLQEPATPSDRTDGPLDVSTHLAPPQETPSFVAADAPICMTCGVAMHRAGACYVCSFCGNTSGCS